MIYECKEPRDGVESTWAEDVECLFCNRKVMFMESESKDENETEGNENWENRESREDVMDTKDEGASPERDLGVTRPGPT